jgi:hypothetical protein
VTVRDYNQRVWPEKSGEAHVESHFLRFNDPAGERAIWLKATVVDGPAREAMAELWCCLFDGERTWGNRIAAPAIASVTADKVSIDGCSLELLGGQGQARGDLSNPRGSCSWHLNWSAAAGALGEPMSLFPYPWMYRRRFPKSKLVTPAPLLRVSGHFEWDGRRVDLGQWIGMQGHNWGVEHAPEYAWGQAWFGEEEPDCVLEGFTGRTRLGPVLSPRLSCLVVRFKEREFRFDRLWRLRDQRGVLGGNGSWNLDMVGNQGRAKLWMHAPAKRSVCLGYENPDGQRLFCFNSKTARAHLWLKPNGEPPIERRSATAALEFLSPVPDKEYGPVI